MAFLPELILLAGALALFVICLGDAAARSARIAAMITACVTFLACFLSLEQQAILFDGAYRVDAFSQLLKLVLSLGFVLVLLNSGLLADIREDVRPEYLLFLTLSVIGLVTLVSAIDVITLVVALELSSFPLYLLVAMRREREGQRVQMESAIKYIMFGIAANGIMLFGLSYLFGLTGTTSLPVMAERLGPALHSPLAITGLLLTFCGLYFKLAVFPFHFWTPDVYQGAAHETASLIASLPKLGAIAVLVRLVALGSPENKVLPMLLGGLAVASMVYGNLIALLQKDLKRLLAFSGIAHAGYALLGFVAMNQAGYTAALYYMIGYLLMVLACFAVIGQVSRDGVNVSMDDLAGLHRRSPLLTLTLVVGVFALAGIPPFVGFMGKLALLKAALAQGYLALVIITVLNTAIAVYYYLAVVREACFRDPVDPTPLAVPWSVRVLCLVLMAGILALGVIPAPVLQAISTAIASMDLLIPGSPTTALFDGANLSSASQ
jgi:NADH-quinone oxidoreductase subunit N